MATSKKTDVATKAPIHGEMAPFAAEGLPDYLQNQGPARGSEEVKSSDMILPRLELVQAQSPIKEENEEAREGHLFNSVTQELYGDFVYFVPVYYRTEYLLWKDQDSGGGFFGSYGSQAEAERRFKELVNDDPSLAGKTKDGKPMLEIVDTPVHYGLRITPEGTIEQIVISMAKSKAKVSRKWNAMVQIAGGDRFARVYKISSFTDENKQGKKFKNFVVQPAGFPPKAVYEQAESIYETFRSGAMSVNHASVIDEEGVVEGAPSGGGERGEI
jgi:hypothetical protein